MFWSAKPLRRDPEAEESVARAAAPAPEAQLPLVADDRPRGFTDEEKVQVWLKGIPASGLNIAYWRFDEDRNLMCWSDYRDPESAYAWEIDHIVPLGQGGTNQLDNLRPIHGSRNRSFADIFDHDLSPDTF